MMTVDVRLLVRSSRHPVDDVLEQLLTGTLRVQAVVQLVPDPRVATPGDPQRVNVHRGCLVPTTPVRRNARGASHHAAVRDWDGEVVRPGDAS